MKRSDFFTDDEVKQLIYLAKNLPEQFATLAQKAKESFQNELADCQANIDGIEGETEFLVNQETDPDSGKPKFTNQKSRDGELKRRLLANEKYQQLQRDKVHYQTERNKLWREKDQCEMKFKAVLAQMRMVSEFTYAETMYAEAIRYELTEMKLKP